MSNPRTREIFRDRRFTLLVVESADLRCRRSDTGYQIYASMEPLAIIVCSPNGVTAFDMEAHPVSLDALRQDVSGLADLVTRRGP